MATYTHLDHQRNEEKFKQFKMESLELKINFMRVAVFPEKGLPVSDV
jgi:hypothetical protein